MPIPSWPLFVNVNRRSVPPPVVEDEISKRIVFVSVPFARIENLPVGAAVPKPKFPDAVRTELMPPPGP